MKKRVLILAVAAAVLLAMTACGASNSAYTASSSAAEYYETGGSPQMISKEMAMAPDTAMPEAQQEEGDSAEAPSQAPASRKLIRRVSLEMETLEFDQLYQTVNSQVSLLGGYVESSSVSGRTMRYAQFVARVPQDKVDTFLEAISEKGNVLSRDESVEDITLRYVDVESHKQALVIEQERLLALLERADKLEDIITLEERLSEVRYQLQNYESQLRLYDNQVDYSTITIGLSEVRRETPVEEEDLGARMKNGLGNTFYNIGNGAQELLVWAVVNLPYLIFWAVVIAVVILVVRRRLRRRNNPPPSPQPPQEPKA